MGRVKSSRDRSSRDPSSRSPHSHHHRRHHRSDRRSRSRSHSRSRSRSRSRSVSGSRHRRHHRKRHRRHEDSRSRTPPPKRFDSSAIASALSSVDALRAVAAIHTVDPQITRGARRLFIGNLPSGQAKLSDKQILAIFSETVRALGITTPDPIISAWVQGEGSFAFLEFRSVQDTGLCLSLLQGLQIGGKLIRVGRPQDYIPPPPELSTYVVGFPPGQGSPPPIFANNPSFMQLLGAGHSPLNDPSMMLMIAGSGTHIEGNNAAAVFTQAAINTAAAPAPSAAPSSSPSSAAPPSPVVVLDNMTSQDVLVDEEAFLDLADDVESEGEKLGKLVQVVIPRPSLPPSTSKSTASSSLPPRVSVPRVSHENGVGRIFLLFEDIQQAENARMKLHDRLYFGKRVVASFFPVDKLNQEIFV